MNPKVDFYFQKADRFKSEVEALRHILLDCQLNEELKWGVPCYTYNGKNVVLIHYFKEYCALLFHKGALLKDPKKILIQQTVNVQAGRQLRCTALKQIQQLEKTIKAYTFEAIEIEKAGLSVPKKETKDFPMPEEFEKVLKKDKNLKKAFESLTPGRQRAYLLYFSSAKQSATRSSRIEKYIPHILIGKGIDD